MMLTVLGMAVGTGNIWRFPRVAASNGGGAFLIAWIVCLFVWALPVLIIEMGMGKASGKGVPGAFRHFMGERWTWLGGFVAVVAFGIMCYYAVVMGWCLRYFLMSLTGAATGVVTETEWQNFTSGYMPVVFQGISLVITAGILYFGVVRGIEKVNRILIPTLFLMLLFCAVRAVQLPGAEAGLNFLFEPVWSDLAHPKVWLEALSQSAWSVGAGWGLALTYGAYMRKQDGITLNCLTVGLGNNMASLLAGIAVLCTVYAVAPAESIGDALAANDGLAFIWLPRLFADISGGHVIQIIFFLAMTCAALSSLIAMIEMATRALMDFGLRRGPALAVIACVGFICGLPSALNMTVFQNQDWVWGLGLLLNGLFIVMAATVFGMKKFRDTILNGPWADVHLGGWFDPLARRVVPALLIVMLGWWFWRSIVEFDPDGWWNPLHASSIGTCLAQWSVVAIILVLLNRYMNIKLRGNNQ